MSLQSTSKLPFRIVVIVTVFLLPIFFIYASEFDFSSPNFRLGIIGIDENQKITETICPTEETVVENRTTILCLVMTRPTALQLQNAIMDTWGSGCTDLMFLVGESAHDHQLLELRPHFYTLILPVEDAWANTWMKIRTAMKFVKKSWEKSYDWIIRIDDDAFLIIENLLKLLSTFDPSVPVQLGARYINYLGGYIGTGPGLILSHSGFDSLMNIFDTHSLCDTNATTHDDDVQIGICLKSANVSYGNSSDSLGRPRFIPIPLNELLVDPSAPLRGFFESYSAYPVKEGFDCCSDDLIGLHYVSADEIRRFHQIIQTHPDEHKNLRLLAVDWLKLVSSGNKVTP